MLFRNRWLAFLIVLTGALPAVISDAYEGVTQVGETGEKLVAFVRQSHENAGFSGAVLAGQGGKVVAAVAVGTLSESSEEPITVDTLFELASCTKPFTAVAVMKLAEEGKLSLDDPIAKHLPGIPASCEGITVRHLLQHTSGIPGTNSRGGGTDLAAVLPTFLEGGPRTPPGTKHAYWNQGYSLLSEVIARASGRPYTQYVREAILEPCKMASTRFAGDAPPKGTPVATGASTRGSRGPRTALEHPYGEYGFQYRGMGGLVTNLIDLWRFDRSLARGKLLSEESLAEMLKPGDSGYALGWRVTRRDNGRSVHGHTGSVRGFLASIRRDPADDACLFVLANSDNSGPFDLVRSGCEALLEGKEPPRHAKPAADVVLPPERVDALIGVYRDAQGRTLSVSRDRRHAKALINWHGPITYGYLGASEGDDLLFGMMKRFSKKAFATADSVTVERTGDQVAALTLTLSEINKSIRFERVAE